MPAVSPLMTETRLICNLTAKMHLTSLVLPTLCLGVVIGERQRERGGGGGTERNENKLCIYLLSILCSTRYFSVGVVMI